MAMEQQLRDLQDIKQRLEVDLSELKGQHKQLTSDNERLKQEVYAFRSSAHGSGISARMAGLEQLVKEKDDALSRMNDLVQETREAKALLETNITQLRQQIQSYQEQQLSNQQETQKFHDAIRKLQDDLRTAKSKVRSASTLAQEQERLRRDTQTQLDAVKRDLQDLRDQYEKKLRECGELEEAKRVLQHELEDVRHLNEGNEKVISWLHRLIPDDRLTAIIDTAEPQYDETDREQPRPQPNADMNMTSQSTINTSTSDYPLAMRREVRQFFNDLGVSIDADTSLPRFTLEELADKQVVVHETGTGTSSSTSSGNDEGERRVEESMSNLSLV